MSRTELQRFATAVQASPGLLDSYRDAGAPAELAARLRADGYDVGDDEVAAAARQGSPLTDEQLDQVSGGSVIGTLILGGAAALGVAGTVVAAILSIGVSVQRNGGANGVRRLDSGGL